MAINKNVDPWCRLHAMPILSLLSLLLWFRVTMKAFMRIPNVCSIFFWYFNFSKQYHLSLLSFRIVKHHVEIFLIFFYFLLLHQKTEKKLTVMVELHIASLRFCQPFKPILYYSFFSQLEAVASKLYRSVCNYHSPMSHSSVYTVYILLRLHSVIYLLPVLSLALL